MGCKEGYAQREIYNANAYINKINNLPLYLKELGKEEKQ
jgi:hypothetical protein